jgi:hypothetical protein
VQPVPSPRDSMINPSDFRPNFETIQLETTPSNFEEIAFEQEILGKLENAQLDWTIQSDEHGNQKRISTRLEISPDELEAIQSLENDPDNIKSDASD